MKDQKPKIVIKRPKNLYKFFDHFGLIVFAFITLDSIAYLAGGVQNWRVYTRLFIGIGGLLVDGYLVFFYQEKTT